MIGPGLRPGTANRLPPEVEAAIKEQQRLHEAARKIRTGEQGYGRPIISERFNGGRVVAVAGRLMFSRRWRFFSDFLLDFLNEAMGVAWLQKTLAEGGDHPILAWRERLSDDQKKHPGHATTGVEMRGYHSSLFGIGYCLYLLAHHDKVPAALVRRLRRPREFRPAAYEAIVAAAFALAGAKVKDAEDNRTNAKTPEFYATLRSGRRLSVEAKCKDGWKAPLDPDDQQFRSELTQWIRNQIYKGSQKRLHNATYWFELSIPEPLDEAAFRKIGDQINQAVAEAGQMTVGGQAIPPAYVVVTNHPHLVNDDVARAPRFAVLEAINMPDFNGRGWRDLEVAMENADRHRDFTWVFDCLEKVRQLPVTFDGTPPELIGPDGAPVHIMKIGDEIEVENPEGGVVRGRLREIASMGDTAIAILETKDGLFPRVFLPLSEAERRATAVYGDLIFGKPNGHRRGLRDDPIALYEWFLLEAFADYPRDGLLNQIPGHYQLEEFAKLPLEALRVRVAREVTKAAWRSQPGKRTVGG